MKKSILLLAGVFVAALAFAQEKKQIKVNKDNGKYELTVEKTVDGKKTVTTRTYDSKEEMMKDPALEGTEMFFLEGGDHTNVFKIDTDGESHDIKVDVDTEHEGEIMVQVHVDGEHDGDVELHKEHNVMVFKGDGAENNFNMNGFEIKTENGETKVFRDGEEISGDSWTSEDGETYAIKRLDGGKIMISNGDGNFEWIGDESFDVNIDGDGEIQHKVIRIKTDDGKEIEWINDEGEHVDVQKILKEHGDGDQKVMIFKSEDGEMHEVEGENVNVFVKKVDGKNEEVKFSVKIVEALSVHIQEIEGNEFEALLEGEKALKVQDINYYPNPSEGKFNLQFEAPKKSTSIQVLSLDGRSVYNEELTDFSGIYNNEIDLSGQKKGIYLLKIQQGSKSMNRKIVLD